MTIINPIIRPNPTHHQRELQIQIDDVYACPGNCGGCVLASEERRATKPDMPPETLALSFQRLDEYLAQLEGLDVVNITFGIADHLRMNDDWLATLYQYGRDLLVRHGHDRPGSAMFFTASLIGKGEILLPRLEKLRALHDRVPIYPIAVLDPAKLYNKNFGAIYKDNILRTKALFGQVDLTINLSDEAIARITPQELHDFAADHGFREVTLNWTPTAGNLARTFGAVAALKDWLFAFMDAVDHGQRIGSSLDPVFMRSINAVLCQAKNPNSLPTMIEALGAILPTTIRHSLQIDHEGYLLPKFEAIGDITHGSRFDLPPLGHLKTAPIAALVTDALPALIHRIIRLHSQSHACMACPHLAICAINGFHVYQHVARDVIDSSQPECAHVAAALINRYRQRMRDPGMNDQAKVVGAKVVGAKVGAHA